MEFKPSFGKGAMRQPVKAALQEPGRKVKPIKKMAAVKKKTGRSEWGSTKEGGRSSLYLTARRKTQSKREGDR